MHFIGPWLYNNAFESSYKWVDSNNNSQIHLGLDIYTSQMKPGCVGQCY